MRHPVAVLPVLLLAIACVGPASPSLSGLEVAPPARDVPSSGSDDTAGSDGIGRDLPVPGDAIQELPPPECSTSDQCDLGKVCIQGRCETGCLQDRDCPSGRHCIPEALPHGYCAECITDPHCEGGRCLEGVCRRACLLQQDCAGLSDAPVCDPIVGACVGCIADQDCAAGTVCEARTCRTGCRGDGGCPKGLFCDRSVDPYGLCVACVVDGHCSQGLLCRDHRCIQDCSRVPCPFDRPVCLPDTGECVECVGADDCPQGRACIGNACVDGCLSDRDCSEGLHCAEGSPGECVSCTQDAHCTPGWRCLDHACIGQQCGKDGDCGDGRYCHPVVQVCLDLPPGACTTDRDCGILPGTQIGRNCDPLSRTCLAECLPGKVCLDPTRFCIDGSCYGCRANADCPGTLCSPLDRECRKCREDSDCLLAGWHCDNRTGACHPCTRDAHCSPGFHCHPEKFRCVECLSSRDCKDPERPECSTGNQCVAACTDDCREGEAQCGKTSTGAVGVRTCGRFDGDPCLEFGPVVACPAGTLCGPLPDGTTGCRCDAPCPEGESRCTSAGVTGRETCRKVAASGCLAWVSDPCPEGSVCNGGQCPCTGECRYGDSRCDPSQINVSLYCGRGDSPCLHWIRVPCDTGSWCNSSTGQCNPSGGA